MVARRFPADEEFDDDHFERALLRLLYLLGELYTHGEPLGRTIADRWRASR